MPSINTQSLVELNQIKLNRSIDRLILTLKNHGKFNRDNLFKEIIREIKLGRIEINLSAYQPENMNSNGYSKYAIYDSKDEDYPFSIWIFAFGYKQKTPIHDHNTECSTALISNTDLEEKLYAIYNINYVHREALSKERREIYDIKKDDGHIKENVSLIAHMLKNQDENISVTMHIYNMTMFNLKNGEFNSSVETRYEKPPKDYRSRVKEKISLNLHSRL